MSPQQRRRLSPWVANLTLATVSLGLTLLVIEVSVRLLVDLEAHKPFGVYDIDPESDGLSFVPGESRYYETTEFHFNARYNSYGRRDVEWSPTVVSDPSSILVIGDSFAYGIGVEYEDTIPSRIEARFAQAGRPVEVMNFGMPGIGAPPAYAAMLDTAIEAGFAARTVVVLIFVGNDFYPNVLEPFAPSQSVVATPVRPASWPQWKSFQYLKLRVSQSSLLVGWTLTAGRLAGISVYDSGGTYIFLRERTKEQDALFKNILHFIGNMKRRCDETGRRLYAVILPNRIQVENGDALDGLIYDSARPNRDILAYCAERSIRCFDLLPTLVETHRRHREPLFYPIDRHLNARGYHLVADSIAHFLLEADVPPHT